MFLTKLKIATGALVLMVVLGLSRGMLMQQALADKPGVGNEPLFGEVQNDAEKKTAEAILGTSLNGVLKAIDSKKNSITVLVAPKKKGDPGEEMTFDLAKDIKVFVDDGKGIKPATFRAGNLADLKEGTPILAELTASKKEVVSIRAMGPTVAGVMHAVDAAKNTITLTHSKKPEGEQEKTYVVAKDAKVVIDGKEAKITDLTANIKVTAKLSGDHKEIGFIQAQRPSVQGVLKAVDVAKNVVTIAIPVKGEPDMERTYPMAKDAQVHIYNKEAKIKNLALESPVTLKLSGFRALYV